MFLSEVNDVKIYNLSAGKSLPDVSYKFHGRNTFKLIILISVAHSKEKKISAK